MTAVPEITLYGASGHAHAIALGIGFPTASPRLCKVAAFLDDTKGGTGLTLEAKPILCWDQWLQTHRHLPCLVPIGDTRHKKRMAQRVATAGGHFPRLYDRHPGRYPRVTIGAGVIILAPGYIGPNTTIADHVQILPMHAIGHDVTIGRYATIAPSVTISGHVDIEDEVFIGAGATIVNGTAANPLTIGYGATIAAGAVVTHSIPPGVTVIGNPARTLHRH